MSISAKCTYSIREGGLRGKLLRKSLFFCSSQKMEVCWVKMLRAISSCSDHEVTLAASMPVAVERCLGETSPF